ncbi:sigma-70 family RNA polymerase sigma factor, partial [Phyllobacterium sp. SYP-B3895]
MQHAPPENVLTSKKELLAAIPALRRFSRTFHKSKPAAEDLVQETLVRAWHALDRYQPGTSMQAWLFTIMRNIFLTDYRKRDRETTGFTTDIADYQGAQAAPQEWK